MTQINIHTILEEFREKFCKYDVTLEKYLLMQVDEDDVSKWFTSQLHKAFEEITPVKYVDPGLRRPLLWEECVDKIQENITKFFT